MPMASLFLTSQDLSIDHISIWGSCDGDVQGPAYNLTFTINNFSKHFHEADLATGKTTNIQHRVKVLFLL